MEGTRRRASNQIMAILCAHSKATWTHVVITNGQVHGKGLEGEQTIAFQSYPPCTGNATWTLAVIANDQIHGKYLS